MIHARTPHLSTNSKVYLSVSIQPSFVSVPLEPGRSFDHPSVGLCCNDFPKHASWGFRALPAMELPVGFEPTTARLQVGCATVAPGKRIQFVLKHQHFFTLSALDSRLAAYYLPKFSAKRTLILTIKSYFIFNTNCT